ncbi:MAG: hypothetical protein WAL40_07700 [Rhodoplanes sp.]
MRGAFIGMAVATGIALGEVTGASAAPASGAAILGGAAEANPVVQVQHWRWGSGGWGWGWHGPRRSHWRWGSGGWGPRCRIRCGPYRCWRVCW